MLYWVAIISVLCNLLSLFQGAEELDIGGGSRRRARVEVAQMKEQLESQVGRQPSSFSTIT